MIVEISLIHRYEVRLNRIFICIQGRRFAQLVNINTMSN